MEDWLSKALDMVPELQGFLFEGHDFDNPISLWIDLFSLLMKAYRETPIDDDLAGRIYAYAAWCFEQPQTDDDPADISTAAAFCLIESIPLDQKISNDLHRWMSVESFLGFENLFRYHLDTEDAYRKFHDEFLEKKKSYSGPSRI